MVGKLGSKKPMALCRLIKAGAGASPDSFGIPGPFIMRNR